MKRAEGGAALIAALLTVALVAGLSVAAFWQQWSRIELEIADRQRLQAQWLANGAMDWARALVGEDGLRSPQLDHMGEAWAQPVQGQSLQAFLQAKAGQAAAESQVRLDLRLSDAQGRLNLLNLLEGQAVSAPWLQVFGRLFEALGLPPDELQRLSEQLRRANLGTQGHDGNSADMPLVPLRQADLGWLGLAPATVQALAPHVTLLPGQLPVNLNTASAPVLRAVTGLPAAQVQQLLARRQAQPLRSPADAGLAEGATQRVGVHTHFFEVRIGLHLAGHTAPAWVEHALLQRDGREVRTLWQRRGLPEADGIDPELAPAPPTRPR